MPELEACEPSETPAPDGKVQKDFDNGRDVGAVVAKRVPGAHGSRVAMATELPPKACRVALHLRSHARLMVAGAFCRTPTSE